MKFKGIARKRKLFISIQLSPLVKVKESQKQSLNFFIEYIRIKPEGQR
jgi:hypothetical protein